MPDRRWIVSQLSAREHYAIPRALHNRGALEHLYTDIWWSKGRNILRRVPDPFRSLANRYHADLPNHRVTAYNGRALWNSVRECFVSSDRERYEHYLNVGVDFAGHVRDSLLKRSDFDLDSSVFFGYDTGSLETLRALADTGCLTFVDQVDPGPVEKDLVLREAERWPGWARHLPVKYEPYQRRREREWAIADHVVVNSEWSKSALEQQGVSSEKLRVIPLAYSPSNDDILGADGDTRRSASQDAPITVLWLGSVILRKGIQYLVEAARQLSSTSVQIRVVGPIGITDRAIQRAPENMRFEGRVSRDRTSAMYRDADLFVLPTLSDGFAITQLEAMAHGLPVIATPRCGRVVTDGEDGRIISPRDADALAEAISSFASDRGRLQRMSRRARSTAQQYTLARVSDALLDIVDAES